MQKISVFDKIELMKSYKFYLSVLFLTLTAHFSFGQKITWETLKDVDFDKKYDKEAKMFVLVPRFGPKVLALSAKTVEITGYMIPIDVATNYYVLSANPYASCFFCGASGPESVMSIKFKKAERRFDTDERLTLKGRLVLNTTDAEELNYILKDAELVK